MENNGYVIENIIPTGHKNALTRKELCKKLNISDRKLRMLIEQSNSPIINVGKGYFIPNPNDTKDMNLLRDYISSEQARINSISIKLTKFDDLMSFGNNDNDIEEDLEH